MDNVTLHLKPYHLDELLEAARARCLVVDTDTSSPALQKAVCADLERRCELLHDAVTKEHDAKQARIAYNDLVQRTRHLNRLHKQAMKQEQPAETPTEETQESPAPVEKTTQATTV